MEVMMSCLAGCANTVGWLVAAGAQANEPGIVRAGVAGWENRKPKSATTSGTGGLRNAPKRGRSLWRDSRPRPWSLTKRKILAHGRGP